MIKSEEPVEYDLTFCKYEQLEIRDALFTFDFISKHLNKVQPPDDTFQHKFSERKMKNLGWLVCVDGEHKNMPFALLKP